MAFRIRAGRRIVKWFIFVWNCLKWGVQTKDIRFLRALVGLGSDRARIVAAVNLVSIYVPSFVSPKRGHFLPRPYDAETSGHGRGIRQLFAAGVLKKLGRFDEAEMALRLLSATGQENVRAQALIALADVLLLQAAWTIEFDAYQTSGVALDPTDLNLKAPPRAGWRRDTPEAACALLAEVVEKYPSDRNALWLYAYGLMVAGSYQSSLTYFRKYHDLTVPTYEIRAVMAAAGFPVSPDTGKQIALENAGRWISMMDIGARKIAPAHSIPSIKSREVYPRCTLSGSVTLFHGREEIERPFSLDFGAVDTFSASDIEILPNYGMIATSEYLVSDTAHVKPIHWQNFTPSIQSLGDESVLLFRKRTAEIDVDRSIYFGHNSNYYHWLLEDLPRAITLMRQGTEGFFLVDQDIKPWQQESLIALGCLPDKWRCADFTTSVRCRELTTTTMMSRDLCVHPTAVKLIREQFLPVDRREGRAGHRLLYLARGGKDTVRKTGLLNEAGVRKIFVSYGFEVIDPGSMMLAEQQRLFSEARVVAGAGGAAFTNLVFAPPGTVSLILAPAGSYCETFASVGAAIGQKMFACLGDTYPRSDYTWINTIYDFTINTNTLRKATDRALHVSH